MNYSRPMQKPQPDEPMGTPYMNGSAIALPSRCTVLRERKKSGVRGKSRLLGCFSRIAEQSYGERALGTR